MVLMCNIWPPTEYRAGACTEYGFKEIVFCARATGRSESVGGLRDIQPGSRGVQCSGQAIHNATGEIATHADETNAFLSLLL